MTLYTVTMSDAGVREVYGGLTACDAYQFDSSSAGAKKYRALPAATDDDPDPDGDERKRLLVSATRWIDSLPFAGVATGEGGTTLQVPRSGVANLDGSEMTSAQQLDRAARATFEAVAILAADGEASTAVDTGSNVRKLDADGTSIEFFRPTSAMDGTAAALPVAITRILGPLLGAGDAAASLAGLSHGTCEDSHFEHCDLFRRTEPF